MVITGDCIEAMGGLPPDSVDSIVTDPPYGLGFMGKAWDDLPPGVEWARECLRLLKPGGHLLAFGGSRTYHRLACAVEDVGFEVRDQMMWLYGSGFPKSLDVAKAVESHVKTGKSGTVAKRQTAMGDDYVPSAAHGSFRKKERAMDNVPTVAPQFTPETADGQQWQGYGTALKPAHEPIVMARKPLAGTVAENVLRFGTGALNIDSCRIGIAPGDEPSAGHRTATFGTQETVSGGDGSGGWKAAEGRWPANVVMDEEAGKLLDKQTGERPSRFFYCAKASRGERNAGLDGFEERQQDEARQVGNPGGDNPRNRGAHRLANHHPTVKPISLMRYLVRLVTPLGGTVLDPFLGSGTTGCAAALEGFDFIGIEQEPEYAAIAEARIKHWSSQPQQLDLEAA